MKKRIIVVCSVVLFNLLTVKCAVREMTTSDLPYWFMREQVKAAHETLLKFEREKKLFLEKNGSEPKKEPVSWILGREIFGEKEVYCSPGAWAHLNYTEVPLRKLFSESLGTTEKGWRGSSANLEMYEIVTPVGNERKVFSIANVTGFFQIRKSGINNGVQTLFVQGMSHSFDPKDKQFNVMDRIWKKFVSLKNSKKIVVIEEADYWDIKVLPNNRDDVIKDHGDFYISWLAQREGIEIEPAEEPNSGSVLAMVLKTFSSHQDDVMLSCAIIDCVVAHLGAEQIRMSLQQGDREPLLEHLAESTCKWRHVAEQIGCSEVTAEEIINRLEKVFQPVLGNEWLKKLVCDINQGILNKNTLDDLFGPEHILGRICFFHRMFRDVLLVITLAELWRQGVDIFCVYGDGHRQIWQMVLPSVLKKVEELREQVANEPELVAEAETKSEQALA